MPYTDEKISSHASLKGRATPGANQSTMQNLKKYPAWAAWKAMLDQGTSEWEAIRSLHSGPKYFKELARGNVHVLDADRKKSFPNAVLDRYPDLKEVEQWSRTP